MASKSRRLHALSLDAGLSIGHYDDTVGDAVGGFMSAMSHDGPDEPPRRHLGDDIVAWLQLEPSWETRSESGTTVRLGIGWSVLLTPAAVSCEGPIDGRPCGDPMPVVGVFTFATSFATGG